MSDISTSRGDRAGRIFGLQVEASCLFEKADCTTLEVSEKSGACCNLSRVESLDSDKCSHPATKHDNARHRTLLKSGSISNHTFIRAGSIRLFEIRRQESTISHDVGGCSSSDVNIIGVFLSEKVSFLTPESEKEVAGSESRSIPDDNNKSNRIVKGRFKGQFNGDSVKFLQSILPDLFDYRLATIIESDPKYRRRAGPAAVLLFDFSGYAVGLKRDNEPVNSAKLTRNLARQIRERCVREGVDTFVEAIPISALLITDKDAVVTSVGFVETIDFYAELPSCPTCLHRIDPANIGLSSTKVSDTSTSMSMDHSYNGEISSPLLTFDSTTPEDSPKPPSFEPPRCVTCKTVDSYSSMLSSNPFYLEASHVNVRGAGISSDLFCSKNPNALKCSKCDMTQTLWICLTCGIVSCGRYSHAHAVDHFQETKHPYSLELATQRVWAYDRAHFVQKENIATSSGSNNVDGKIHLREQVLRQSGRTKMSNKQHLDPGLGCVVDHQMQLPVYESRGSQHIHNGIPSKKSSIVGEVYEARLEASLAHQADFFEGEISSMRAEISGQQAIGIQFPSAETEELNAIQREVSELQKIVGDLTENVIKLQCHEEERRMSHKVLRQQQVIQEKVLSVINTKIKEDQTHHAAHIDELKQQIWDLEAFFKLQLKASKCSDIKEATVLARSSRSINSQGKKGRRKAKLHGK